MKYSKLLKNWYQGMNFFALDEFFSGIWILKIGVKINFRVITKNHAADSK